MRSFFRNLFVGMWLIAGVAVAATNVIIVNGVPLLFGTGIAITSASPPASSITWIDPLLYLKPAVITLNEPNDAAVANKYWVDMTSGSGSTCSQGSPCADAGVIPGKPGTSGGPVVIYLKGTGNFSWFQAHANGSGNNDCRVASCTNWIVFRPWPAGSPGCVTECTATITTGGNFNQDTGSISNVIIDGGPNLNIRFNSNGATGTYVEHIQANYFIVYRTQMFCTGNNQQLGWAIGDTSVSNHVYFINNEFYGCLTTGDQISAVYVGPGSGGGYTDFVFQNNIVRDMYGDGIEINPRVTSGPLTITGNAIHNVGFGTCTSSWNCRPGITVSIQSGSGSNTTLISNNLIWNVSSGCIWNRGGGSPAPVIANNTCYDYGKGTGGGSGDPNPQGISGFSNGGTGTYENNIIYAPNGTAAVDSSSVTKDHNLCAVGQSCGTSMQNYNSSTTFASTTENTANYLFLGASSAATGNGVTLGSVTVDYAALTRSAPYDIGALNH